MSFQQPNIILNLENEIKNIERAIEKRRIELGRLAAITRNAQTTPGSFDRGRILGRQLSFTINTFQIADEEARAAIIKLRERIIQTQLDLEEKQIILQENIELDMDTKPITLEKKQNPLLVPAIIIGAIIFS